MNINPNIDTSISQNDAIRNYLDDGNRITAMLALTKFHCFRLASRISDLKERGVKIQDRFIRLDNGKRVKEYWIEKEEE